MAMMKEYAAMAKATYWEDPYQLVNGPFVEGVRWWSDLVPGWSPFDKQLSGSGLGEAFQGVAFAKGNEVVYAFKGTDMTRHETSKRDLFADLKLALGMNTTQYDRAMTFTNRRPKPSRFKVSVCGHSLGGAIAQVVANRLRFPFVTFNAPGVAVFKSNPADPSTKALGAIRIAGAIPGALFHPFQTGQDIAAFFYTPVGVNFRLGKDFVGTYGVHYGPVIELPFDGSWTEAKTMAAHAMDKIAAALMRTARKEQTIEAMTGTGTG